jgi:nitrate/TMAO reductase-like tetraheme cytochrome c subunit
MAKFLRWFFPHTYISGIILASVFFILGTVLIGIYASAVDYTNSTEFCAFRCHEMQRTYDEYIKTKHYKNEFGVRAECPDCHVPHQRWQFTMYAKAVATNDLFEHFFGHYATAKDVNAVFEAERLDLAKRVWARMEEDNSRECRNCHSFEAMALADQRGGAKVSHELAMQKNMTCIDCHKGVAHKALFKEIEKPGEGESFELK